jgi:DNA-binding NtrC family response regulator
MEIVRTSTPVPFASGLASSLSTSNATSLSEVIKHKVLICDNEDDSCAVIAKCLTAKEFQLTYCQDFAEAGDRLRRGRLNEAEVDILLWGLTYPYEAGLRSLQVLQEVREANPKLRVVLLAPQEALAFASAIKAANCEAFVLKPLHAQDLRGGIERALKWSSQSNSVTSVGATNGGAASVSGAMSGAVSLVPMRPQVASQTEEPSSLSPQLSMNAALPDQDGRELGLIGASREMRKVVSLIRKIGPSCVNVLITGESGSGKEMVASAIHQVSDRAKKPFIAINCAAIPRELLESELFGHAKGAFTGATAARRGLFEEAHEGTILLDEIGDLPLPLQAKILRLLQTRQVKPLGQNTVKEVDVRIISATHKNLKSLIQKGEFREDLYYRLNVMPIHLPPLRERKDDIIILAEYFLKRYFSKKNRGSAPELTKRACNKLLSLPWKGNVRELENVIERAIVLSDGVEITESEIISEEMEASSVSVGDLFNSGMTLKDIEREYIKHVLNRTGNRKEAATRILGIDRKTLYRKEKLYGIRPITDLN